MKRRNVFQFKFLGIVHIVFYEAIFDLNRNEKMSPDNLTFLWK